MTNTQITYLVGGCCGVLALGAYISLVVAPALTSYRRAWERVAVLVLSAYVFAAVAGVGVVLGAWIILQWPRWF